MPKRSRRNRGVPRRNRSKKGENTVSEVLLRYYCVKGESPSLANSMRSGSKTRQKIKSVTVIRRRILNTHKHVRGNHPGDDTGELVSQSSESDGLVPQT